MKDKDGLPEIKGKAPQGGVGDLEMWTNPTNLIEVLFSGNGVLSFLPPISYAAEKYLRFTLQRTLIFISFTTNRFSLPKKLQCEINLYYLHQIR